MGFKRFGVRTKGEGLGELSFPRRRESIFQCIQAIKKNIKFHLSNNRIFWDIDSRLRGNDRHVLPAFALRPLPSALLFIAITLTTYANAASYTQDLNDFINLEIKPLANSDIVIDNLNKMNEQHAGLSEINLGVLENNWRSEMRKMNQPLISQILENDLSKFLVKTRDASQGVYTELTIIDSKGLNVSQTVISPNYWNFGKPRWDKTLGAKSYAPYISDIYYSDETNKFQVEVSFIIISDEKPIGVIAAGIDVEQLEDWKKRMK